MPQLRRDPIVGRWVIIASERARRPVDFKTEKGPVRSGPCPFCEGNEASTPPEILAVRKGGGEQNSRGWSIRVVPNKFPALMIEGELDKCGEGIYDLMNGVGAHEVIIESPEHKTSLVDYPEEKVREILWAYRERLADLKRDMRFVYGLIFKNVGDAAGASLEHSHSQLIVTPVIPKLVQQEMDGAKRFFEYRNRCIFCDMLKQEIETEDRIVMNEPNFVAFAPFAPRFPFETWILPKRHATHLEQMSDAQIPELAHVLHTTLKKIEGALNHPPYNFIVHTSPFEQVDNYEKYYHWHIEIMPRITRVAGFEWGTGFYINPVPPENAAGFLREFKV